MVFGIHYCLRSSNYNGMDYNLDNLYFINPKNIFFKKSIKFDISSIIK